MLTQQEKQKIASHFIEALEHEDLYNAQAARFLNLNPCYVHWIKNEKYWSDISQAAWDRFNEWHKSRCKLSEFIIPEDEPIWEKKKNTNIEIAVLEKKDSNVHSVEILDSPKRSDKQKCKSIRKNQGEVKNIKINILNQELETLNKRINILAEENTRLSINISTLEDEIKELQNKIERLITTPRDNGKPAIILFQRNIYKP